MDMNVGQDYLPYVMIWLPLEQLMWQYVNLITNQHDGGQNVPSTCFISIDTWSHLSWSNPSSSSTCHHSIELWLVNSWIGWFD